MEDAVVELAAAANTIMVPVTVAEAVALFILSALNAVTE